MDVVQTGERVMEMGEGVADTSQVPLRELPQLATSLREAIGRMPAPEKTRAAVEAALSAQCVQCGIRLSGADVLALPDSTDARLERLRHGYCARNGCDCHFYNVSRAPHADFDWARLMSETNASVESQAAVAAAEAAYVRRQARRGKAIRIGVAIAALLAVYVARQLYMGGRIPFIREPEKFQVDTHAEPEQFEVDRVPEPPTQQTFEVDRRPAPPRFQVDRNE